MAESRSLILAFIDRRPAAAARVLAAMEPEDAAGLLEDLPTRYATRALAHMGAWSACTLLARMSVTKSAAVLAGFPFQSAAALLRLMDREPRLAILQALPAAMRRDFRTTLAFPDDAVGAHMTTAILTQRTDHTVADGRDHLRRAGKADTGCVVVVDETHRLAGLVSAVTLLRATGNTPLVEIMDTEVEAVSARARLATVRDLAAWDRYASVPVTNRRGHVIGVLSHAALRKALAETRAEPVPEAASPLSGLSGAFVGVLAGMAALLAPGTGSAPGRPPGESAP